MHRLQYSCGVEGIAMASNFVSLQDSSTTPIVSICTGLQRVKANRGNAIDYPSA